jgi:ABC-type glycerol-3-phosphate transport system permease component
LIPFAWIFLTSQKKPGDVIAAPLQLVFTPTLENYQAVLFNTYSADSVLGEVRADIPHTFLNSLLIACGATLLALVRWQLCRLRSGVLRAPGARILHGSRTGSHVSAACRAAQVG